MSLLALLPLPARERTDSFIAKEPWDAAGIEIVLQHVVSRVTVMTKSKFEVSDAWPLTVTVPTVYDKYNVEEGKVVTGTTVANGYTFSADSYTYEANKEVAHFYFLGDGNNQELTFRYKGPNENPEIEIRNVSVSANTHITLTGDIYNVGLVNGFITAAVSEDWPYSSDEYLY